MVRRIAYVVIIGTTLCSAPSFAEEEKTPESQPKVQGLDLVTDSAAALISKGFAMLSGNLEVTVSTDTDRIKNKNNYTENVLGEKVPKATAVKSKPQTGQSADSQDKKLLKATL